MASHPSKHEHIVLDSEDPTLISNSTVLDEKTNHVEIDLNVSAHDDPHNPFAFSTDQLSALMDPKNVPLLRAYGGLEGVARGLHVNLKSGLIPNAPQHPRITLDEVTKDEVQEIEFKRTPTVHSLARQYTHKTIAQDESAFPQRKSVFGRNVLPETQSKNLLQLMWIAFQDKTLVKNSTPILGFLWIFFFFFF
jgi:Ca2+-transporting ATPase